MGVSSVGTQGTIIVIRVITGGGMKENRRNSDQIINCLEGSFHYSGENNYNPIRNCFDAGSIQNMQITHEVFDCSLHTQSTIQC